MVKVEIAVERCIGAGHCSTCAPTVFGQDDDGLVVLLMVEVPEEQRPEVEEAAELCPTGAIIVAPDA
jgi:ferredoxin